MHPTWEQWIGPELTKPYYLELQAYLAQFQNSANPTLIYPQREVWFAAFDEDPEQIKVVILGQDPYHGPNQAHGYAFSMMHGCEISPSLLNIYKEILRDVPDTKIALNVGHLDKWINQGVFLLNTALTVKAGHPKSHIKKTQRDAFCYWEPFTNAVLAALNTHRKNLVFMLWGDEAKKKAKFHKKKPSLIDRTCHKVLETSHPSPLGVYRGFRGCGHFSQANAYLKIKRKIPINWSNV